jgi:hypothetical protein
MTSSSDRWAGLKLDLGHQLSLLPRPTHPHIGIVSVKCAATDPVNLAM